jgi:hypothetical protein
MKQILSHSLSVDLGRYVNNTLLSDVRFRCEDGEIVFAHKVSKPKNNSQNLK